MERLSGGPEEICIEPLEAIFGCYWEGFFFLSFLERTHTVNHV